MPPNLQEVTLKFSRRVSAKVMGSLAQGKEEPHEGTAVKGILVSQNFQSKIIAPEDLQNYTQLRVGSVSSKIHVPFAGKVETIRLFLNEMFSGITEQERVNEFDGNIATTFLMTSNQLNIVVGEKRGIATVEWSASPVTDLLADSVIALLMHAQSSAASIRLTSKPCRHRSIKREIQDEDQPSKKTKSIHHSFLEGIKKMLSDQFESVQADIGEKSAVFELQTEVLLNSESGQQESMKCEVCVEFDDDSEMNMKLKVKCDDKKIAANIRDCIRSFADASRPIISV
jgi:hypothetical protein